MPEEKSQKVRIAALGDIHITEDDKGKWKPFFEQVSIEADILLLAGDLTDRGSPDEARILAREMEVCSIPVIAVLGNHDYEMNQENEIKHIIQNATVHVLEGESLELKGIGFAGIKGFGGGFGRYTLPLWGEKQNKEYVQESVNDALKLDQALTKLNTEKKLVLMHYAPIPETLSGEPEQIFPFLGTSRLCEPIEQRQVTAVFHGHAHIGTLEGKTPTGINVFNVSRKVLRKAGISKPFFLFNI